LDISKSVKAQTIQIFNGLKNTIEVIMLISQRSQRMSDAAISAPLRSLREIS